MRARMMVLACALVALTCLAHAVTENHGNWIGVWRAKVENQPGVTLTLADDTGSLDGTIVFYGLDGETHKVVAMEPHTLIHPTLDGNALTFQVKRLDATLITVKVVFITPTKAELHCLNCGDDAPLAELTKETL